MPIPLSIILFDRGAGGAPTTNNPVNLAGKAEGYEDTLSDRYGFETARVSWTPTVGDIDEWNRFDHLLRPMVAYSPDARIAWEGVLAEIAIEFGTKTFAFSLKDMANRLTVRFSEPGGAQGDSATYSNAASQALFGIKDRVINASIAASAAASNQAQTDLNVLAFPRSKQPSSAGTPRGTLRITLTFWGKYALLDWLLTSNTSTANTATSTQIASLLAAYVATNPLFSATAANIAATGVADTEYIEPDTTYREKIERLLARGNASQQPLAWGLYEGGVFTVAPRASATPETITYYESEASGQIRDAWQNVVDPWDVRPNAMARVVDLIDAPTAGAAETPLRKYVARVTRSVRGHDVTVTLEPEDTESLESLLTSPAGAGPAGTSDRQAAFERKVTAPGRSVFAGVDNDARYDRTAGVWKPRSGGTGKANTGTLDVPSDGTIDLDGGAILTGGGSIDTGGRDINYPPGTGAYTGVTGSGVTGALTKWSNGPDSLLTDATAGVDYATPASAAPIGAKYIVQQADATLTNEQALGSLSTGILKNTTATGVLSIAVAGTDYVAPGSLNELIDDEVAALLVAGTGIGLTYNDAANTLTIATSGLSEIIDDRVAALLVAGTGISLSYNDAGNALTISNTGGTVGGTGTAGRIPQWATGGADIENSTLIKSGAGLLTLSAAGAATLTIDSSIRLDGAGASAGQVLEWNGTAYAPATLAPADVAAAPDNAKYIVQQPSSGLSAEQALSALATGLLKNTTTTGVLSIAVAGTDYAAAIHTHAASDITSGVLATARLGSGTANSTKYLAGDSTWQTLPSGVTGSAAATQVAYFSSAGAIAGNSALTFDVGAGDLFVSGVVNSNTHIEVLSTQVLGPRRHGWGGPTGTATRTTFATGTVTLVQLAERFKALIDDLSTHGLIGG